MGKDATFKRNRRVINNIGQRLRYEREVLELSRQQLAAAAGVTYDAVRKLECGERVPNLQTVAALASAMGHRLEFLLRDPKSGPVVGKP